jgi:hypothetical protein
MPTKHLTISNHDDNTIYYHREDLGDAGLAAGASTSVSLTVGDALYIRTTDDISHTIDLSCVSSYTTSYGYYKISYANAVDGDDIDCFR